MDECHVEIKSSALNHHDPRIMHGINARIILLSGLIIIFLASAVFSGKISGQNKIKTDSINYGYLFSAILFRDTPLGEQWAKLKPEAESLYPNLKLKTKDDLHVTVIYIGKDWKKIPFDTLRAAMSVNITDTSYLVPEISVFGKNNNVVAVELKGISENLLNTIIAVKDKLNKAGLKKPEAYDRSFRAHVTLAETKDYQPNKEQLSELKRFREWICTRLDLSSLSLIIHPGMPVELMLAGATRPNSVPEYISVKAFYANQKNEKY